MGYDSSDSWKTKKDVVRDCLRHGRFDGLNIIVSRSTRSGLWMVVENAETGLRGIYFDLIEKQGGRYYVKSMCESECPYYFDCPQDLVNMVPPTPAKSFMFSVKWRAMRVEARP